MIDSKSGWKNLRMITGDIGDILVVYKFLHVSAFECTDNLQNISDEVHRQQQ